MPTTFEPDGEILIFGELPSFIEGLDEVLQKYKDRAGDKVGNELQVTIMVTDGTITECSNSFEIDLRACKVEDGQKTLNLNDSG